MQFTGPTEYDACGTYTLTIDNTGIKGVSVYPNGGSFSTPTGPFEIVQDGGECVTHNDGSIKSDISFEWTAPDSDQAVDLSILIVESRPGDCNWGSAVVSVPFSGTSQCATPGSESQMMTSEEQQPSSDSESSADSSEENNDSSEENNDSSEENNDSEQDNNDSEQDNSSEEGSEDAGFTIFVALPFFLLMLAL